MTQARLQSLLGGLSGQSFLDEYFDKNWLHSRAATPPGPFSDLVTLRDLELLLFDGDRGDRVLLAVGGPATPPGGKASPNRRCSTQEALDEWAAGRTLVFNGIDYQLPAVRTLARDLEGELKCRVSCNLYLTPAHGRGFATHFDPHEVFVVQLIGSKQWRIGPSAANSPMLFQMDCANFPAIDDDHVQILMQTGDVLYIPRGRLHDAATDDELSCHLTIGLHPKTRLDAILAAAALAADRDPEFRQYLPLGSFSIESDVVAEAQRLMASIRSEDFRQTGYVFCEFLASQKRRSSIDALGVDGKSGQFSKTDRFRAIPHLMCSLSRTADAIELHAFGKSIVFALSAAADVELCCSGKMFRVSDLHGPSSSDESNNVLRRLMVEGVVRRLAPDDSPGDVPVDIVRHPVPSAWTRYLTTAAGRS